MQFGKNKYFTKEHFEMNAGYAPPYLCELVVYCLELLSFLSYNKLKFRFKGGNSILLILPEPQRFSIDIDIATAASKKTLIQMMENITEESKVFTKLEIRQHKTKPWLPMISFKIFFNSFFQNKEDAYIMLDAVLHEVPYAGKVTDIILNPLYSSDQKVEVATPAGLIGDKLLTIGPATLGIPIGKGKEAQRLKHVFDISRLSGLEYNQQELKDSFLKCMEQEHELQKNKYTTTEIIDDTIKFCTSIDNFEQIPDISIAENDSYLYEIIKGFQLFKSHIFKYDYTWQDFKKDMQQVCLIMEEVRVIV